MGREQSAWILEANGEMRHHRQEEHLLLLLLCVPLLVSAEKVVVHLVHLVHLVLVVRK